MNETDCLLRLPVARYKWELIFKLIEGQPLALDAKKKTEALMKAAKAHRMASQAYMKVGVVQRNLVVRVKYGSSHITTDEITDDIKLVLNFKIEREGVEESRQLAKDPGRALITKVWWQSARGTYINMKVEAMVEDAEKRLKAIDGARSKANYAALDTALDKLTDELNALARKMGHKDDHKIVTTFAETVARAASEQEGKARDYAKEVESAQKKIETSLGETLLKPMLDQHQAVLHALGAKDASEGSREFAKLAKRISGFNGRAQIDSALLGAELYKVAREDIDRKGLESVVRDCEQQVQRLNFAMPKLREQLDALEDEAIKKLRPTKDEEQTVDKVKLARAVQLRDDIYRKLIETRRKLEAIVPSARQLANTVRTMKPDDALKDAGEILAKAAALDKANQATSREFREVGSPLPKLLEELGLKPEAPLRQRLFTPTTNLCIGANAASRLVVDEIKRLLVLAASYLPTDEKTALEMSIEAAFKVT